MNDQFAEFLASTTYLDTDHPLVIETAHQIAGNFKSKTEAAIALFYYVRDEITYNPYVPLLIPEDYTASAILGKGFGFCVQKAVLLATLCRAANIPAQVGFADIKSYRVPKALLDAMGTNLFTFHGYAEIFLDGKWLKATPAFDREMCKKMEFRLVEFDGKSDGILHAKDLKGRKHIEYVKYHGSFTDLPYKLMADTFIEVYSKTNPDIIPLFLQESTNATKS